MTAIFTKYLSATNSKSARISVRPANGGKGMIISKEKLERMIGDSKEFKINTVESNKFKELNDDEQIHTLAAWLLCESKGWKGELAIGSTKEGYVFVFIKYIS